MQHDHDHRLSTTQLVACALLGFSCLILAISGRAAAYVQGFWLPFVGLASALIVISSLSALWTRLGGDGAHRWGASRRHDLLAACVLLSPAVLLVLAAPGALGAGSLGHNGVLAAGDAGAGSVGGGPHRSFVRSTPHSFPPLGDGLNEVTLEDIQDRYVFGDAHSLDGHQVRFEGFVSYPHERGSRGAGGQDTSEQPTDGAMEVLVSRYKIYCCAADAVPYTVAVRIPSTAGNALGGSAALPQEDQWVQVTGVILPPDAPPGTPTPLFPTIDASTVRAIDTPKDPYL